jgi:hypothetical protein
VDHVGGAAAAIHGGDVIPEGGLEDTARQRDVTRGPGDVRRRQAVPGDAAVVVVLADAAPVRPSPVMATAAAAMPAARPSLLVMFMGPRSRM